MAPSLILILLLSIFAAVLERGSSYAGLDPGEYEKSSCVFLMREYEQIVKTEAGEVRLARRAKGMTTEHVGIGFIRMEPKSLFLPHFLDADLILFLHTGAAKVGWVRGDDLIEKNLRIGDVYRIPRGSVFYLMNTEDVRRLQIICCLDASGSVNRSSFQPFFVAGGSDPETVFSGFDDRILSTAFNVSREKLQSLLKKQTGGPIIYTTERQLRTVQSSSNPDCGSWRWRHFMESFIPQGSSNHNHRAFNIFRKSPDFQNNYGWSLAVDGNDYPPLDEPDMGIFYVNLSVGSMMAPHVNARATEYAVITKGKGRIQIAFPNGTSAMDVRVKVGDAFVVPQYFPICQMASLDGPMEFFGFSTSARGNRPLFLAGSNSVLNAMKGSVLATAFDMNEKNLHEILNAQKEAVILPAILVPRHKGQNKTETHSAI